MFIMYVLCDVKNSAWQVDHDGHNNQASSVLNRRNKPCHTYTPLLSFTGLTQNKLTFLWDKELHMLFWLPFGSEYIHKSFSVTGQTSGLYVLHFEEIPRYVERTTIWNIVYRRDVNLHTLIKASDQDKY